MADYSSADIQRKQDEFRRAWEAGESPKLAEFLKSVALEELQDCLQVLIPIDIEFRAVSGEVVDYKNYVSLGEHAARIAAAYFSMDETPGPDAHTVDSHLLKRVTGSPDSDFAQRVDASHRIAGKYKLIQQIGAGGMGAVWLAQQELPVRRRVALKVIRADLGSTETIARFEAERQALAMMNHPSIAQVLDAGTLDDGSPFFVMELVKGIPLTRYCNENRLSVRKRLELLIPVCDAIQHAHQKGIVHRDIKPSNILVSVRDDKPIPKVIDFGLAKALEHQNCLTDQTMLTEQGRVIGTLQYMSPEQAGSNELDVDARTDIYSLGVVLYQLLTGTTPLMRDVVATNTLINIIGIICDAELQRPSIRLKRDVDELNMASRQRQIEPNRLIQMLQGELDWIAMQALEKDRTKRYQTANSLADDLKRFIKHEPVLARPPSTAYLVRKFVGKHRGLMWSVLLATAFLIAGICSSTYYAISANRQRNRADNQLEAYKALLDSANPATGASKEMSAYEMMQNAEQIVDAKLSEDPISQAELLHWIGVTFRGQGQTKSAVDSLRKAFDLRRENLGANDPLTLATQSELAIAFQRLDYDRMFVLMKDVYERRSKLLPSDSAEMIETRHYWATANFVTFNEKKKLGEHRQDLLESALRIFAENYDIQKTKSGAKDVDTLKTLTNLANAHLKNQDVEKSIELGKRAIAGWQEKVEVAETSQQRNMRMTRLLKTKNNYAEALQQKGDFEQAINVYRQTLELKHRHFDPGHPTWRTTLRLLVVCLIHADQAEDAKQLFRSEYGKIRASNEVFDRANILKKMKQELEKSLGENLLDSDWLADL